MKSHERMRRLVPRTEKQILDNIFETLSTIKDFKILVLIKDMSESPLWHHEDVMEKYRDTFKQTARQSIEFKTGSALIMRQYNSHIRGYHPNVIILLNAHLMEKHVLEKVLPPLKAAYTEVVNLTY